MMSPRRLKQFVDAAIELQREGVLTWEGNDLHIDIHHPNYRRKLFPKLGMPYTEEQYERELAEYEALSPKPKALLGRLKSQFRKWLGKTK